MKRHLACVLSVACLVTFGGAVANAAQQGVFKTRVDLVRIDALVTIEGKPVVGLGADDFEVIDNGVPQRVEIAVSEPRFNVILVLDVSGSVKGDRLSALLDGVNALVGQLRPGEQVALVAFNDEVALRVPMTADVTTVKRTLTSVQPRGNTAVCDALFSSLGLAWSPTRTLVLLYSDGADNASWLSGAQVIEAARRADVVVCPVAVGVPPDSRLRSARFLDALADRTGGRLFNAESTRSLRASMVQVLTEFRSRYLVAYVPTGVARDDGWHHVEVRVTGRKTDIRTKDGYLAHAERRLR